MSHLSDDDLERYLVGQTQDEDELARVEEHLIGCPLCMERAEAISDYISAMRKNSRRPTQTWEPKPVERRE